MYVTCTIITTEANEVTRPVHYRMPVIVPEPRWGEWLSLEVDRVDELQPLMVPYEGDDLEVFPVSTHVNRVQNDDSRCIESLV